MTIHNRLTLWYSGLAVATLAFLGWGLYHELVCERQRDLELSGQQDSVSQEIQDILAFYALPALALTLLGGWWLTRRALAPVARLAETADRITLHNLGERLPASGQGDELDRLTVVFNRMLDRLDGSLGQMREFTLHASHELKTPLTIMRGELETALRHATASSPHQELFASQLDEIQRLTHIVEGLTLLAQADAGRLVLHREPVRLEELVRDSFTDAQILAQARGLTVELAECSPVLLEGDRHRLRQLLLNLTDNAIKYNHPHGQVRIGLHRNGTEARLEVSNTGPGILPQELPHVFNRFYRGSSTPPAPVEGCGLGLSIAQWIVTAHGGSIAITSDPGRLTTLTVRLPVPGSPTASLRKPQPG